MEQKGTFPAVVDGKLETDSDEGRGKPGLSNGDWLFLGFLAGAFVAIALAIAVLIIT